MEIDDQHIATAGGFIFLDVLDNFSDPDGDDLSFAMAVSRSEAAGRNS